MRKHLSLIDDDHIFHFMIDEQFKRMNLEGWQVQKFMSADDALAKMEGDEDILNVVLLDINMPIKDGFEYLKELSSRSLKGKFDVFILTSSINQEDRNAAKQFSMVKDYLVKPIKIKTLQSILDAYSTV